MKLKASIALMLLALASKAHSQNLIVNGEFDVSQPPANTDDFSWSVYREDSPGLGWAGLAEGTSTAGVGWYSTSIASPVNSQITAGSFEFWKGDRNTAWGVTGTHLELTNIDTDFGVIVYQDFIPTLSGDYELSFLYGLEHNGPGVGLNPLAGSPFTISIQNQDTSAFVIDELIANVGDHFLDYGDDPAPNGGWKNFTDTVFLESGVSYRLAFTDVRPSTIAAAPVYNTHLDSVSLTRVDPVPEPSAALMVVLSSSLALIRRKRRE